MQQKNLSQSAKKIVSNNNSNYVDKDQMIEIYDSINEEVFISTRNFILQFLQKLLEDLQKYRDDSALFNFGKTIGLNNGDIEKHKKRIASEFEKFGYIYHQMQEMENSIYNQKFSFYENIDADTLISPALIDKSSKLKADLDINNPDSYISKVTTEIENYKHKLSKIEKKEWINLKDVLYNKIQIVWKDHDLHISELHKQYQQNFKSKLAQLDEIEKNIQSIINNLLDISLKIESEILSESDSEKIKSLEEKKAIINRLIEDRYRQKSNILSFTQEEVDKLDLLYRNEIKKRRQDVENRADDFTHALKTIPENPDVKSRFYLTLLFLGFLLATTAEIAIMNKFTGEVLGIGTFSDKIGQISELVSTQGFSSSFLRSTEVNKWIFLKYFAELLFLISFSAVPFLLSFITKMWFDIRSTENTARKYFFYLSAPVGILYLIFLSYNTAKQNTDPNLHSWQFGVLLFSISFSVLLVSGWLLHNLVKGYEKFKQATNKGVFPWEKSYLKSINPEINKLHDQIKIKQKEFEEINQHISGIKEHYYKNKAKFQSLKINMPSIEIDKIKEAATSTIEAGYDFGISLRGKGEIDENYLDNKSIEELVELEQKLEKFYDIFDTKNGKNT